jgi:uncharacterized protein (UPF0333 family)
MFALLVIIVITTLIIVIGYFVRSKLAKKELSMGPNKLILLADDLDFVNTHSSLYMSRVRFTFIFFTMYSKNFIYN